MKKNLIVLIAVFFISVLLFGATQAIFTAATPSALPVYTLQNQSGERVYASSIEDISSVHTLKAVNYTPNEFVDTGNSCITNAPAAGLTEKGTYQFFVMNLDPLAEDYEEKSQKLDFLTGPNGWQLTLYIPPVLSSCVIYVRSVYVDSIGEIEGYDYQFYYVDMPASEKSESKTEGMFVDVTLHSNWRYLSAAEDKNERMIYNGASITVHYQAEKDVLSGIDGNILIGEDSSVRAAVNRNDQSTYILSISAVIFFFVLLFVSILKRRGDFLPQLLFTVGVVGATAFTYLFVSGCSFPYLAKAIYNASFALMGIGGALSTAKNFKKIPVRLILTVTAAVCLCVAFALPFASAAVATVLATIRKGLTILLAVLIAVGVLLQARDTEKVYFGASAMIACVLMVGALFDTNGVAFFSPIFTLCACLWAIAGIVSFREFFITEKRNAYLTTNLLSEVDRQTKYLEDVISERDKLLRYLSHDLKKPVTSIEEFLTGVSSENEEKRAYAIEGIRRKINSISDDLNELRRFAKSSYTPELPVVTAVSDIFAEIYEELNPDCVADGVNFKITPSALQIFSKPALLLSVLRNLIFNALEHANCTTLVLSASKQKDKVLVTVTDNGVGVLNEKTLFEPYYREENGDNQGLGLYLCREHIRSMGGDLTYRREQGATIFTVTLPLA